VERNFLLLATFASDLPLRTTKFCSLLFDVVVHAGCDKDLLMRGGLCGKLHGEPSQFFARDFCLLHLQSMPPLEGVPVGIFPYRLLWKKLEWCGYATVKDFYRASAHDARY